MYVKWRVFRIGLLAVLGVVALMGDGFAISACSAEGIFAHMQRYQSFAQAENGDWTAWDQHAAQLLREVEASASRGDLHNGCILLYPSFRGNEPLGLVEPVLNVLLIRRTPIGADSLSIATGDLVYDFVAVPEEISLGGARCERFQLPLGGDGLGLFDRLAQDEYAVALYADAIQVKSVVRLSENLTGKAAFEARSRQVIAAFCNLYREVGMEDYTLWPLNAAYWSENRPIFAVREFTGGSELPLDSFGCVDTSDRASAATLQELLRDASFYAGKIDGKIAAQTRSAIREAQLYYGQLPTGQANAALLRCLAGEETAEVHAEDITVFSVSEAFTDAALCSEYLVEGVVQIRLERLWVASKILSEDGTPGSAASEIAPGNASNRLLAVDGWIINRANRDMNLPLDCALTFTFPSGYEYTAAIRCEQANGTQWGTKLLPMERARIVAYAEIPAGMAAMAQEGVCISLRIDGMGMAQPVVLEYR